MVHPALVGGIVAAGAIAVIMAYLYYEEHFSHEGYARFENPVYGGAHGESRDNEEIEMGSASETESEDDDALERFAKRVGLRRRRPRRREPDESEIQEKFSHVTAMEQELERRRIAVERERNEIEIEEAEMRRRRSVLGSAAGSEVGSMYAGSAHSGLPVYNTIFHDTAFPIDTSALSPGPSPFDDAETPEMQNRPIVPVSMAGVDSLDETWGDVTAANEDGVEVLTASGSELIEVENPDRNSLWVMEDAGSSFAGSTILDEVSTPAENVLLAPSTMASAPGLHAPTGPRSMDSWDDLEDLANQSVASDRTL